MAWSLPFFVRERTPAWSASPRVTSCEPRGVSQFTLYLYLFRTRDPHRSRREHQHFDTRAFHNAAGGPVPPPPERASEKHPVSPRPNGL
eukprot:1253486-Prymnesium_polylepis.1